jgi:hypothetical protein
LVNATVDPDEAASRLPAGLRPHVTEVGTVVGCCLLDIAAIRPAPAPAIFGRRLRAVAHRISVEWDHGAGNTVTGVFVPIRYTDSRLAVLFGGRWFPGVHAPARIELVYDDSRIGWTCDTHTDSGLSVRVTASIPHRSETGCSCEVGATCLSAAVGVSPDHSGHLEAAGMEPCSRDAIEVDIDDLDSRFLDSFATATPAKSYLMRDTSVAWTPAPTPRSTRVTVSA